MKILRDITLASLTALLIGFLTMVATTWSIRQVLGNPKTIKSAFSQSGIYKDGVVDGLLQQQAKTTDSSLPIKDKAVQMMVSQSFTPQFVQSQTEGVVDSLYGWLQGKQQNLSFTVDLSGPKAALGDHVYNYVLARFKDLPLCTTADIPSGTVDPFGATCRPAGVDAVSVATQAKQAAINNDYFKNTTIDANTIKTSEGVPLSKKLNNGPKTYRHVAIFIGVVAFVCALLSAALIFLSPTRRNGIKRVAIIYTVVAALIAALGWMLHYAMDKAANEIGKHDVSLALQSRFLKVTDYLVNELKVYLWAFALGLFALAAAGYVYLRLTRRTANEQAVDMALAAANATTLRPASVELQNEAPAKPRKAAGKGKSPKKLIQ